MRCAVFHIFLLSLFQVFYKGKKVSVITKVFHSTLFPGSNRCPVLILLLLLQLLVRKYRAGVPL